MPPQLIGIQIRPTETHGPFRKDITFDMVIGYRDPQWLFISSPSIRHTISESQIPPGEKLGYIETVVNLRNRTIDTRMVYPFIKQPALQGKGAGTLIELQIERWFAKKYPGYLITSNEKVSQKREAQLRKRGRIPGKTIEIERAVELTRKRAVLQFQTHFLSLIRVGSSHKRKMELKKLRTRR